MNTTASNHRGTTHCDSRQSVNHWNDIERERERETEHDGGTGKESGYDLARILVVIFGVIQLLQFGPHKMRRFLRCPDRCDVQKAIAMEEKH